VIAEVLLLRRVLAKTIQKVREWARVKVLALAAARNSAREQP
jgi:hypothetical protein